MVVIIRPLVKDKHTLIILHDRKSWTVMLPVRTHETDTLYIKDIVSKTETQWLSYLYKGLLTRLESIHRQNRG